VCSGCVPEAEECISYGMPAFKVHGKTVGQVCPARSHAKANAVPTDARPRLAPGSRPSMASRRSTGPVACRAPAASSTPSKTLPPWRWYSRSSTSSARDVLIGSAGRGERALGVIDADQHRVGLELLGR
jgi:hypothetical protein